MNGHQIKPCVVGSVVVKLSHVLTYSISHAAIRFPGSIFLYALFQVDSFWEQATSFWCFVVFGVFFLVILFLSVFGMIMNSC